MLKDVSHNRSISERLLEVFSLKDHSSAPANLQRAHQKMWYSTYVILDKLDSPPLSIK